MFQGTGTALITPFDKSLNVDYTSLKKLVEFQIQNRVNALVVLGTTGEAATIDDDERKKIIETVIEQTNRRVPVIVGTGTNNTKKVVVLNKIAEDCKADALLIVNPYYNKGTQSSLVEHYRYISELTPLPIILYNVPSRTAMNMLPETVLKIHDCCPNVCAMKEASSDISQIARLMAMKPDTLTVFSGNDDQTVPIMAMGAKGVISVFSNVYPSELVDLTDAMLRYDLPEAQALQKKYLSFMNKLFIETSPAPVKFAVSHLGLCSNTLRMPLAPVSESTAAILIQEMEKYRSYNEVS